MKIKTSEQKVWFTADPHFGHKNILSFCPETRKGTTIQDHDRFLIETWQETVAQEDLVFILGDVSFADEATTHGILGQLPGQKVLVRGNHDKVINNSKSLQTHFIMMKDYLRVDIDSQMVVLFHYPIMEWANMHYGSFHFHGHIHGKPSGVDGRIWDVGIDTRPNGDMKLWGWEELRSIMLKQSIRSHH